MKKIKLVLPVVKVTLDDVANLRAVLNETGKPIKCGISERAMTRLRSMGLITTEQLPPCPKQMAEFNEKMAESERLVRVAVKRKIDWELLGKARNLRPSEYSKPKNRTRDTLTAAGLKLLKVGSAQIEIQEPCS